MKLAESLAVYSNTDSPSIIASLLYSSLRNARGEDPDPQYIETIEALFGKEVCDIVKEALEMAKIPFPEIPAGGFKTEDEEEKFYEPFLDKIKLQVRDERSLLIRMTEWQLYLHTRDSKSEDPAKHPSPLDLSRTKFFYAPLAEHFYLRRIEGVLGDEWLRLSHPKQSRKIQKRIDEVCKLLKQSEKEGQSIQDKIFAALGPQWEDKCEIEMRIKSASSIFKKLRKRTDQKIDLSDIIGIRIIIDADSRQERRAVYAVEAALDNVFRNIEKRRKDYVATPKSNGYRSLHKTYYFNGSKQKRAEVQIVSRGMYAVNENNHRGNYKHPREAFRPAAKEVGNELRQRLVTIFTQPSPSGQILFKSQTTEYPESQRYRLRFGSTAADMLQYLEGKNRDVVFEVAKIDIERGSNFRTYNKKIPAFRQFLASSDEIRITRRDPALIHDPKHRQMIIDAVTDRRFKTSLIRRHKKLLLEEQQALERASKVPAHALRGHLRQRKPKAPHRGNG
jgi:hypothetical protein